jgi:hypothetical protein
LLSMLGLTLLTLGGLRLSRRFKRVASDGARASRPAGARSAPERDADVAEVRDDSSRDPHRRFDW